MAGWGGFLGAFHQWSSAPDVCTIRGGSLQAGGSVSWPPMTRLVLGADAIIGSNYGGAQLDAGFGIGPTSPIGEVHAVYSKTYSTDIRINVFELGREVLNEVSSGFGIPDAIRQAWAAYERR